MGYKDNYTADSKEEKKLLVSKTAGTIWLAESNKVPSRSNIKPKFEIVFKPSQVNDFLSAKP
jgi:hypothetical protein